MCICLCKLWPNKYSNTIKVARYPLTAARNNRQFSMIDISFSISHSWAASGCKNSLPGPNGQTDIHCPLIHSVRPRLSTFGTEREPIFVFLTHSTINSE